MWVSECFPEELRVLELEENKDSLTRWRCGWESQRGQHVAEGLVAEDIMAYLRNHKKASVATA